MQEVTLLQKILYYFAVGEAFVRPLLYLALLILTIYVIVYVSHKICLENKMFKAEEKFFNEEPKSATEAAEDALKRADIRTAEPTIEELENMDV